MGVRNGIVEAFSGSNGIRLEWYIVEQNIERNYTKIHWTLKGVRSSSGWVQAHYHSVWILGNKVSEGHKFQLRNGEVISSGEYTITHNEMGNGGIIIGISSAIISYGVNAHNESRFEFPDIPRQARITWIADWLGDEGNLSFRISNPASSRLDVFLHVGQQDRLRWNDIKPVNGDLYTIVFTDEQRDILRTLIGTNRQEADFVLRLETVRNGGVTFSHWTDNKRLRVQNAEPDFNDFEIIEANQKVKNTLRTDRTIVQNVSTMRIHIAETNKMVTKKGATPVRYEVEFNGRRVIGDHKNGDIYIDVLKPEIAGTSKVKVTAVDSRGLTKSVEKTIDIKPYKLPVINVEVKKDNELEPITKIEGNVNITDVDGRNTLTVARYYAKSTDSSSWQSQGTLITYRNSNKYTLNKKIIELDTNKEHIVRIEVEDGLGITHKDYSIPKGNPLIHINAHDKTVSLEAVTFIPQNIVSLRFSSRQTGLYANKDRETFFDFDDVMTTRGAKAITYNTNTKRLKVNKNGILSVSYLIKIWDIEAFGGSDGYELKVYIKRGSQRILVNAIGVIMSRYEYKFPGLSNYMFNVQKNDEIEFVYSMGKNTSFTILGDWGTHITYNFIE